ncbi:hypothetical protein [Cellulosilyticum ruminicola]|uniref:hypothetical protein n=1 Tax=Cellulosilyticum ruminicola TaxID=425254 RepID=UPI0006CFDDDA|nr:hypothetical protein [Cellulosilyticum ruminicola]
MNKVGGVLTIIVGVGLIFYEIGSGVGGLGQAKQISKRLESVNIQEVTYVGQKQETFTSQ